MKGKEKITETWKSKPTVIDVDQDSFISNHHPIPHADDDCELSLNIRIDLNTRP